MEEIKAKNEQKILEIKKKIIKILTKKKLKHINCVSKQKNILSRVERCELYEIGDKFY